MHKKIILIFAAAQDKDVKSMLSVIDYKDLVLTGFGGARSYEPSQMKEKFKLNKAHIARGIKEALKKANELYEKNSLILISGSFFLVAQAKQELMVNRLRSSNRHKLIGCVKIKK